jgi:hypothetical protein
LLNVFVLKNVLNFALPAKPESGCQKTTLSGLLAVIRRRRCQLEVGKSSTRTSEVSARENFCPLGFYLDRDCQHTPSMNIVNGVFEIFGENFSLSGVKEHRPGRRFCKGLSSLAPDFYS